MQNLQKRPHYGRPNYEGFLTKRFQELRKNDQENSFQRKLLTPFVKQISEKKRVLSNL